MTPNFHFTVEFLTPSLHIYHVNLTIDDLAEGKHTLSLPVWTPGAYEIQDFSRHIFDMTATLHDTPIELDHLAKNLWTFDMAHAGRVTIRYQVYAFELGVATSHLDASHAYWNGAQLFFLVDEYRNLPIDLTIAAPANWLVSTGLDRRADQPFTYRANNYDVLIDSPFEIGHQNVLQFEVDHKMHDIAMWGHGNENPDSFTADVKTIVETQRDIFGSLPYDHYTFIMHLSDKGTGGLEHLNSTTCGVPRFAFKPRKSYIKVLTLISHEFFHLWNVKRIHPDMLGPFDYNREVYTRLLWAMEGFTDYFASLALRRGNLVTPQEYFEGLGQRIQNYEKRPGRYMQSLSDSSFDTWIKLHKPNADSPNRTISYYLKGDLVGTCLDLDIRHRTHNQKSLDDVLRLLYQRYGKHGTGFPENVYQETIEEITQSSFAEFFAHYIDGTTPVPFAEYLNLAGLHLERGYENPDDKNSSSSVSEQPTAPLPWIGIESQSDSEEKVIIETVYSPGPSDRVLQAGDQILAINNFAVGSREDLDKRIRQNHAVGDTIRVSFFRHGQLLHEHLVLGQAPFNQIKIVPNTQATAEQQALFLAWIDVPWSEFRTKSQSTDSD